MRVCNFSAGPTTLSEDVLKEIQKGLVEYENTGMSVLEMSHRSQPYYDIHDEFLALMRELLNINDDYEILVMQGGASAQFDAIPANFLHSDKDKADYIVTGHFSNKAWLAAKNIYKGTKCIASTTDTGYTTIPDFKKLKFTKNAKYVHITSNNTVYGCQYKEFPKTEAPLVCDMSSDIASYDVDYSQFDLVYAGLQKNLGSAGGAAVIIKKDLLKNINPKCPITFRYDEQARAKSILNTPPTFTIFVAMMNLRNLKKLGGVKAIEKVNKEKAALLYDFLDNSKLFKNRVEKKYRSIMNVPFFSPSKEMDQKFIQEASKKGFVNLAGYSVAGGMRVSIYNNMKLEPVKKLVEFMKDFEVKNK